MNSGTRALVIAALLAAASTAARAQGTEGLPEPGATVRVTFPCDGGASGPRVCRARGTVLRTTPQLIEIEAPAGPQVHPLAQLTRLDVAAGTRSNWPTGAVLGFVTGAGVTLMVLSAGGSGGLCDPDRSQDAMGWGPCLGVAGAGGIVLGGVGAAIGMLHRSTRWLEVPLP